MTPLVRVDYLNIIITFKNMTHQFTEEEFQNWKPFGSNLIVELEDVPESTPGGIHLPSSHLETESHLRGKVIKVGPGRPGPDGEIIPCKIQPQSKVLMNAYAGGMNVQIDKQGEKKKYRIQQEETVIAYKEPLPNL